MALHGPFVHGEPLSVDAIPVSEEYVLRVWEVDDGLPNNSIFGIAQTPDGYLWLATSSGLARFDGARFTSFLKDATPGLESNRMRTVFVARDGALWIGLERGGVARRAGDRFETIVPVAPPGTASTIWTSSFAQDAAGAVWSGFYSERKVLRWHDGTLSTFSGKEGIGPGQDTSVYADAGGRIWFTTTEGCGVFDGKRFQSIDSTGGGWAHLASARDGGMWAARGGRLLRYRADGSHEVIADLGLAVNTL